MLICLQRQLHCSGSHPAERGHEGCNGLKQHAATAAPLLQVGVWGDAVPAARGEGALPLHGRRRPPAGNNSVVEARIMAGKIFLPPHIVVSLPLLLPVCASCPCPNGIPGLRLPAAKQVVAMVGLQLPRPPTDT
jgi:hypothetical protein